MQFVAGLQSRSFKHDWRNKRNGGFSL